MTLRRFYLISVAVMAAATLGAAAALAALAWRFEDATESMTDAIERLDAAQDMRANIHLHHNQSLMRELENGDERLAARQKAVDRLKRDLAAMSEDADNSDSRARMRDAQSALVSYLSEWKRKSDGGLFGPPLFHATAASVERLLSTIDRIIAANVAQGRRAELDAIASSSAARVISTLVAFFVLAAGLALAWASRAMVAAPLWKLRERIDQYRLGSLDPAATSVGGAEDIRAIEIAFDEMRGRLEEQRARQLTSLAGIAHDIRNPVGALQMCGEILAQPDLSSAERLETAAIVERQARRLGALVSDVLDEARAEIGRVVLRAESIDLRELARESVALFRRATSEHEIALVEDSNPVEVLGDANRLAQVLNNLLTNALKYSPAGGRIEVACTGRVADGAAEICVRDAGVGFDPEDAARIFEPFQRADAVKNDFAGVGIGLSVSRRIVEAHGGAIEARSDGKGKGSLFTVRLPLAAARSAPEPAREASK